MVWLDCVEIIADRDHAVPGSVGFKIVGVFMRGRMGLDKRAQVGDQRVQLPAGFRRN